MRGEIVGTEGFYQVFGIGRGVDLILYLWLVISLIVVLNLHLKLRAQMEIITVIAREIAIANVRSASSSNPSGADRARWRVDGSCGRRVMWR